MLFNKLHLKKYHYIYIHLRNFYIPIFQIVGTIYHRQKKLPEFIFSCISYYKNTTDERILKEKTNRYTVTNENLVCNIKNIIQY